MKDWIPNSHYGGHAFDLNKGHDNVERFTYFLEHREEVLPWIKEFSPNEHTSADDPPVYMIYDHPPAMGERQMDPTIPPTSASRSRKNLMYSACRASWPIPVRPVCSIGAVMPIWFR